MDALKLRQLLARWRGRFKELRLLIDSGFVSVPPLKRIPEPPLSYQEFRAMVGKAKENGEEAVLRIFLRRFPRWIEEVRRYQEDLQEIRIHNLEWAELALATGKVDYQGEGVDPIDCISEGEDLRFVLLWDFEFEEDETGTISRRKLYIPLHPERYLIGARPAGR